MHPGRIRRYSRTRAAPAYPKTCIPAPPSSNRGRWLWLTVRQRQAPPWRQHWGRWLQFAFPRTQPMSMCSVRVGHLASACGLGAGPTAALPPPGALSVHLAARATAVGRAATRAWHLKTRSLRNSLSNFHGCVPLQNTLQRHGDALGDWTPAREKSGWLRAPHCQRVGSTVASTAWRANRPSEVSVPSHPRRRRAQERRLLR